MKAVVTEILACFKTVFERFGLYLDCQTAQSHNVTFFSLCGTETTFTWVQNVGSFRSIIFLKKETKTFFFTIQTR